MTDEPVIHSISPSQEKPTSNVDLSTQVIRVRNLAQQRLASFAKLDPANCIEVYLMKSEHFCGLRFTLGAFRAVWRIENSVVDFFRGETSLGQVEIDGDSNKRVA